MSHLFYDHLISLGDLEKEISKATSSVEEKHEAWNLVDEMVHHRVMGCILDKLPQENHNEFLEMFHATPHDNSLIDYLKEKIGENVEEIIKQEIGGLAFEILGDIGKKK